MSEFLNIQDPREVAGEETTHEAEESPQLFDMGSAGMMSQQDINDKFKEMMKEKGPAGAMLVAITDDETKRKVVHMSFNEPTEEELKAAMKIVKRRVALCEDDENHTEHWHKHAAKVNNAVERHKGAKIVAHTVNAYVVYENDEGTPTNLTVGAVAGGIVGIEKCIVPHAVSHVELIAKEMDIPFEEALRHFSAKIRAQHYEDTVGKKVLARTASKMMLELEEAGQSPEDNPALSQVLVELMRDEFKKHVEEDGGIAGALQKLAALSQEKSKE